MNTIENQVTSLELSKQLKEVGYPQEGIFWWYSKDYEEKKWIVLDRFQMNDLQKQGQELVCFVAPTVAELGEALPIIFINCGSWLKISKTEEGKYSISYEEYESHPDHCIDTLAEFEDKSLANAMAKMWLYLKKEKLV